MKQKIKDLRQKRKDRKEAKAAAKDRLPRITNETVASHREEVLSGARKYIYPLQHSKHKVVIITSTLFVVAVLSFLTYCVASLYKLQNTGSFMYRVTQVLPFPVARSGGTFISYESYLFELRHYTHYYEVQLKRDFTSDEGNKQQLDDYKKKSLEKVINDAFVKKIAKQNNIIVAESEVDSIIQTAKDQNRLGGSSKSFEDSIKEYYGWTENDFRRRMRGILLEEKVNAFLDTESKTTLDQVTLALANGAPFADVAKQYSQDDLSKQNGGEFGIVDATNTALQLQTFQKLFSQAPGEMSEPILVSYDAGYAYQIVKTLENDGTKAKGAHIIIKIADINTFLNNEKEKQPTKRYIAL